MSTKELSNHALVAKTIRGVLAELGVKQAKVKASAYSMGSSVNIFVTDLAPSTIKKIETEVAKYEWYNSEYRKDVPQVKHVFVNIEFSDELTERAYKLLTPENTIGLEIESLPETYAETRNDYRLRDLVYRILRGTDSCNFFSKNLWSSTELSA